MSAAQEFPPGFKFEKEPECWCGPDSVARDPEPFPDVPEGHFQLTDTQAQELQKLHQQKTLESSNLPVVGPSGFVLKGGSAEFERKRNQLLETLDREMRSLYTDPQSPMKETVTELLKVNNSQVYDLSDVEYNHSAALKDLEALNNRIEEEKRQQRQQQQAEMGQMFIENGDLNQGRSTGHQVLGDGGLPSSSHGNPKYILKGSLMVPENEDQDTVKLVKPARSFAAKMAKFNYHHENNDQNRVPKPQNTSEMIQEDTNRSGTLGANISDDDADLTAGFRKKRA